jgi:hypothetical protein
MMTTTERLYKVVEDLPEPALAEVLDFAEFLRSKLILNQASTNDDLLIDLAGGLERSVAFSGDPLVIQKRLRDEWN